MKDVVLHPVTERQLQAWLEKPSHAALLSGPPGSGKLTIAHHLVEAVLQIEPQTFGAYSYGMVLSPPEGKAISIESVRELEHFLSLKVPRNTPYNRAVIIEDSQLLTDEAQNALLKTLEEPPAGTLIVLTASHEQSLLPTIRSRAQMLGVRAPAASALTSFFSQQGLADERIKQAYAVSGGVPGLMHAILHNTDHPLLAATGQARELLGLSIFDRLLLAEPLSKQKPLVENILFILQQMAHVSLRSAQGASAQKWQSVLQASYQASETLSQNAQPKLVLTNLMLQL